MRRRFCWSCFAALFLVGGPLWGAPKRSVKKPVPPPLPGPIVARMSPGDAHERLLPLVGKWNAELRAQRTPDGPLEVSKGASEMVLIHGGRFLKQEFKGDWNGTPLDGMGLIGHNNVTGRYESLWIDNSTTGMVIGTGALDETGRVVSFAGHVACPITGDPQRAYRSEWRIIDINKNIYRSYFQNAEGGEFLALEIVYTRK